MSKAMNIKKLNSALRSRSADSKREINKRVHSRLRKEQWVEIVRTRRDEEEEEMNLDVNVLMKRQTTIEKE